MDRQQQGELPLLRWGILGTGYISTNFVQDLVLSRPNARAKHVVSAIGTSSLDKGTDFIKKNAPGCQAKVYTSYAEVYEDPAVDIIYIGTPHACHKQNALDAIRAGKHVLCEKAFTITSQEAEEVLNAALQAKVFIMEAMWTRFRPLVHSLHEQLFEKRAIGSVKRTFCDFGLRMDMAALPNESRLKDPALGAGSLLDIGIYSLTWGLITLDPNIGDAASKPKISAVQSIADSIDTATTITLLYPSTAQQGILTSSLDFKTGSSFCRIEGTEGSIEVSGPAASVPTSFTVRQLTGDGEKVQEFQFDEPGHGLYWQADAVAQDIAEGRLENATMPHAETMRVMRMLDEVRRQGGARFPQDDRTDAA